MANVHGIGDFQRGNERPQRQWRAANLRDQSNPANDGGDEGWGMFGGGNGLVPN